MSEEKLKYAPMYFTFKPEPAGEGCMSPRLLMRGAEDIPGAQMVCGFIVVTDPVLMKEEPHYHADADEYLAILGGTLPDVFASWDAEVHFYMGPTLDKMEKIVITEPTMVKVPRGWWHGPLNFVRVDKPIFFQPAILGRSADLIKMVEENGKIKRVVITEEDPAEKEYKSVPWTVINEDGVTSYTDKGAYDDLKAPTGDDCLLMDGKESKPYSDAATLKAPKPPLSYEVSRKVLAMPREITGWGEWCPCPQTYFRGTIYMEEATYDIGFQLYCGDVDAEVPHFHSSGEEYLFFMGPDPKNPMDFDAEIELPMGDGPDNMETQIIRSPTVVRVPPNTWHAPIRFRNVKKPVLFQAAYTAGNWGVIYRAKDRNPEEVDGTAHVRKQVYEYMGNDTRMCIYNEKKRCNICGRCFKHLNKEADEERKKKAEAEKKAAEEAN